MSLQEVRQGQAQSLAPKKTVSQTPASFKSPAQMVDNTARDIADKTPVRIVSNNPPPAQEVMGPVAPRPGETKEEYTARITPPKDTYVPPSPGTRVGFENGVLVERTTLRPGQGSNLKWEAQPAVTNTATGETSQEYVLKGSITNPRKSEGIQPTPKMERGIFTNPEQHKALSEWSPPGTNWVAENIWGFGKNDLIPNSDIAYTETGQPYDKQSGVKLIIAPNPKFVMAETFVNLGAGFAGGSVFRHATEATKVLFNPTTGKALGTLGKIVKANNAILTGAASTGMGADIGKSAYDIQIGALSGTQFGNKMIQSGAAAFGFIYGASGRGFSPMKNMTPTLVIDEYSTTKPKVDQLNLETLNYDKVTAPIEIKEFSPNAPKPRGSLTIIEQGGRTKTVTEPYTGVSISRPVKLNIIESTKPLPIKTLNLNTLQYENISPVGNIKFLWETPKIGFRQVKAGGGLSDMGYKQSGFSGMFPEDITTIVPKGKVQTITKGFTSIQDPTTSFSITKTINRPGYSIEVNTMLKTDNNIINFSSGRTYQYNPGFESLKTGETTRGYPNLKGESFTGFSANKYLGEQNDIMLYKSRDFIQRGNDLFKSDRVSAIRTKYPGGKTITKGTLSDMVKGTETYYSSSGKESLNIGKTYEYVPKEKGYYGGGGGFDTSGITETTLKNDLKLPGGVGDFGETGQWSKIDYQGSFPKIGKPRRMNLSELEYGVNVKSSHWSGKINSDLPSLLPATSTISFSTSGLKYESLLKPATISTSINKSLIIDISASKTNQDVYTDVRRLNDTIQDARTDVRKITDTITIPITTTITVPTTIPFTTTTTVPIEIRTPEQQPPRTPERTIPGIPWNVEFPSDIRSKKTEQPSGFNVYIKDRSYVHGKKRYAESWKKANTAPLSEEAALSLGGTAVDQSAAASFKIRPTDGQAKQLKIGVDPWGVLSGKFYKSKGTYIESTSNRIDSSGEIKGISALGWIANQRRTTYSPVSTRIDYKAQGSKTIQGTYDIPDFSKIMRGMGL